MSDYPELPRYLDRRLSLEERAAAWAEVQHLPPRGVIDQEPTADELYSKWWFEQLELGREKDRKSPILEEIERREAMKTYLKRQEDERRWAELREKAAAEKAERNSVLRAAAEAQQRFLKRAK